jgi:hypothetical protein
MSMPTPTKNDLITLRQEAEVAASKRDICLVSPELLIGLLDIIDGDTDEIRELYSEISALRCGGDYD